jgi:hypothetical protein
MTIRICPGKYFAEHALFLTIASILMLYQIDKPSEMEHQPDPKDYKFSSTLTVSVVKLGVRSFSRKVYIAGTPNLFNVRLHLDMTRTGDFETRSFAIQ